jgi:hypothetical protein
MSSAGRVIWSVALSFLLASPAAALVYQVNASAACPGSGTAGSPFCAISSAAAIAAPGDVVNVAGGIYREQVTPANSGAAGLPITYRSTTGARIYGTDNLSGASLWTISSGTTYSTPFDPDTNPQQVFVNDVALTQSLAGPGAVPVNGFFYDTVADVLYVNLGGANPGASTVEAGARSFGFAVEGKSYLVIEGFEVRGHNTNGIRVRSSANVAVRGNRVRWARSFGLVADGTAAPTTTGPIEISGNELLENGDAGLRLRTNVFEATVADNVAHHNLNHGFLVTGTTASVFRGNELHSNARPGGVSTTGFLIEDADGNRIERNLAYDNQDSGFQASGGADANTFVRNISYANGDHGFDIRESDGNRLVSNTAWANANDGYSVEGNVTNAYLRNNIASDNGLMTNGNNLYVDTTSTVGFSSDYDVFHRSASSGSTIQYNGVDYTTVAAFLAATGNESHGSGGSPNFANPNAGDFHPTSGAALDSADAGAVGFQALDFDGRAPIDLASVPNTGAGSPNYADRGALERGDTKPHAKLRVTPLIARVRQLVTANASGSTDDAGIKSYRFEWGDGSVLTQAGPIATHAYTRRGIYLVRVKVTDGGGQSDIAYGLVLVF